MKTGSAAAVLPDLGQRIEQRPSETSGTVRIEVRHQPRPRVTHLLHREHHPGLGVVVVVRDGDRPGDRRIVVEPEGGGIIDGTAHTEQLSTRGYVDAVPDRPAPTAAAARTAAAAPTAAAGRHAESDFIRACRSEPHDQVPVWFMRQAGRSLPEYRAVRGIGSILDAIAQPELAAEITLQPVRRHGVDAAILYSDIMTPVHAIGFGVDIAPGIGPVVAQPFTSAADLDRLRPLDPEGDTGYVLETVRILADELPVPLIAFAGAPFTVASYLVEGQPSRTYGLTKKLMLGDEPLWFSLMDRLADLAIASLRSQVAAGASAVQLFDSWAGALDPQDYRRYVLPASAKVLAGVADLGVPRIHFGVITAELLGLMAEAGAEVVGVDWRTPLDAARTRVPAEVALQGNLDPARIIAGWDATATGALDVLERAGGARGHIFNLGHGVQPESDPGVLTALADLVHTRGTVT